MNGRERREQLRHGDEAVLQRVERGAVALPEPPAREAHVPVGEVDVDERGDRAAGGGGVERLEALGDLGDRRAQARADPAVEVGRLAVALGRVQREEVVGAPELPQEEADAVADRVDVEAVAVPRLLGREEVPAERVRAVAVDDVPRHDDVAARLAHLLAVGVEDEAEADDVLVRRAAEEQRVDGQQRVEPPARLVERLADVVGGEAVAEDVLALVRRVPLGERHRPGVEPDVDDLRHAGHLAAALGAREVDVVDVRPVRVLEADAAQGLELVERADARGRGPRRSARRAAACPSSARATAPSRRCPAATRPCGRS